MLVLIGLRLIVLVTVHKTLNKYSLIPSSVIILHQISENSQKLELFGTHLEVIYTGNIFDISICI